MTLAGTVRQSIQNGLESNSSSELPDRSLWDKWADFKKGISKSLQGSFSTSFPTSLGRGSLRIYARHLGDKSKIWKPQDYFKIINAYLLYFYFARLHIGLPQPILLSDFMVQASRKNFLKCIACLGIVVLTTSLGWDSSPGTSIRQLAFLASSLLFHSSPHWFTQPILSLGYEWWYRRREKMFSLLGNKLHHDSCSLLHLSDGLLLRHTLSLAPIYLGMAALVTLPSVR